MDLEATNSTPLPENPFLESALSVAYKQCLVLESKPPDIKHHPPPIVCARLLGHLLRLAPTGNAQGQLQREIASAEDGATLMQLAAFYLNGFIRTFRRSSRPTPAPSEHLSRPLFEDAREYATAMMEECKLDHRSARNWAMRRNDYRCMITGRKHIKQPGGQTWVEAVHIIPESVNKNIEKHDDKRFHSARVWSILSMFSTDNVPKELAGNQIHRLENIMSLSYTCHRWFDELYLWLKPMEGVPHMYRVCVATESVREEIPNLPEYVTFSTTTDLPLPNHEYLALHALCCEVAWMSGAAEYIMDIERRMDDATVLASDASNVDLLMTALSLVEAH